jgi:hypothetical protein
MPAPQPFQPKLHMTDADFLSITLNGKLCDNEGGLGEREFELVMREQVRCLHAMTSLPAARAILAAHQLNAWGKRKGASHSLSSCFASLSFLIQHCPGPT